MRKQTMPLCAAAAVLTMIPHAAIAQQAAPAGNEVLANGSLIHTLSAAPVTGQPYSATQVHETVKTLADGTTVRNKGHHFVARDGQGRTHIEMRMANGKDGAPDTVLIFVSDPVAHTITTWASGGNSKPIASVVKLPSTPPQRQEQLPAPTRTDNHPQPIVTTEDLGAQTLSGVVVEDTKITTIVPAGRSGNSAPITKTQETWTSADMKLVLKEQWTDPRIGVRTISLEKFSKAEPDPALFRAPAGYTVKDAAETLRELAAKVESTGQ